MADAQLEAVNYLLGLLGSNPVGDLTNPHPFTAGAIKRLDDANTDIQREGWWFNKEYHFPLYVDATSKEIAVPNGVLELTVEDRNAVVKRGDKLYDTVQHSYQFDTDLTANIIFKLDFNLLDETIQDTIKYFAGIATCNFDLEDSLKASEVEKFYTKNYTSMKKTHLRTQRRNILNNPATARARSRIRPYRRSGSTNPLYPGG